MRASPTERAKLLLDLIEGRAYPTSARTLCEFLQGDRALIAAALEKAHEPALRALLEESLRIAVHAQEYPLTVRAQLCADREGETIETHVMLRAVPGVGEYIRHAGVDFRVQEVFHITNAIPGRDDVWVNVEAWSPLARYDWAGWSEATWGA